jgi:tetratricopeptide (TPR) repeat protein
MINIRSIAPLITYLNPRLLIKADRFHSQRLISEAWRQYRKGDTGSSLTGIAAALREQEIHPDHLYQAQHIFDINLVVAGEIKSAKIAYRLAQINSQFSKGVYSTETQELAREFKILKSYPHYLKGLLLTSTFRREEAIEALKKQLEEKPNFIFANLTLAENYFALGRHAEALKKYDIVIKNYDQFKKSFHFHYLVSDDKDKITENIISITLFYAGLRLIDRKNEEAENLINNLLKYFSSTIKNIIVSETDDTKISAYDLASVLKSFTLKRIDVDKNIFETFENDQETFFIYHDVIFLIIILLMQKFYHAFHEINDYNSMEIILKNLIKLNKVVEGKELEKYFALALVSTLSEIRKFEEAEKLLKDLLEKNPDDNEIQECLKELNQKIAQLN